MWMIRLLVLLSTLDVVTSMEAADFAAIWWRSAVLHLRGGGGGTLSRCLKKITKDVSSIYISVIRLFNKNNLLSHFTRFSRMKS